MTAAFIDVQRNPENMKKYENNPKVIKVMEKLSASLGGGMGEAGETPSAPRPPPTATSSTSAKPTPPSAATADMDLD